MAGLVEDMKMEDLTPEEVQGLTKTQWISLAEEIDLEIKKTSKKGKLAMEVLEGLLEKDFFLVNDDVQDKLSDWPDQLQQKNVVP